MAFTCSSLEVAFIVKGLVACAGWGQGRGVRTSSPADGLPAVVCLL